MKREWTQKADTHEEIVDEEGRKLAQVSLVRSGAVWVTWDGKPPRFPADGGFVPAGPTALADAKAAAEKALEPTDPLDVEAARLGLEWQGKCLWNKESPTSSQVGHVCDGHGITIFVGSGDRRRDLLTAVAVLLGKDKPAKPAPTVPAPETPIDDSPWAFANQFCDDVRNPHLGAGIAISLAAATKERDARENARKRAAVFDYFNRSSKLAFTIHDVIAALDAAGL